MEISSTKVGDFFCSVMLLMSRNRGCLWGISFATYDIPIVRMTIANLIVYRGCVPRLKSFSLKNVDNFNKINLVKRN